MVVAKKNLEQVGEGRGLGGGGEGDGQANELKG